MLLGMRIFLRLLASSLVAAPLLALTVSTSLPGCGGNSASPGCTSCGIPGPYCFNLQTDSFNCGACGKSCQSDQVCQDGQCVKTPCSVAGGCTGDAGTCCGATCCAFPD